MEPMTIAWLVALGLSNPFSFLMGKWTERARTERKVAEFKRQVLMLSKKSSGIEDRYKKLLYTCAMYELALLRASQSQNEEVRSLILEFSPVAELLKEGGSGWIERLRIRFQLKSARKRLQLELQKGQQ